MLLDFNVYNTAILAFGIVFIVGMIVFVVRRINTGVFDRKLFGKVILFALIFGVAEAVRTIIYNSLHP